MPKNFASKSPNYLKNRRMVIEALGARRPFAADLNFESNFEEQNAAEWAYRPNGGGWNIKGTGGFVSIGAGDSVALVDTPLAYSGSKAMQVQFKKNEDYGGAEVPLPGHGADTVRTSQMVYFGKDFDFARAIKIHRLSATDGELSKLDFIVQLWGKPTSGTSDMSGINDVYNISFGSNGSKDGPEFEWSSYSSPLSIQRDRWYEIRTELKLNDAGTANGDARLWLDGQLIVEKTGIAMRKSGDWGVNRVLFGGWYSNSAGGNIALDPARTSTWLIDNVKVQSSSGSNDSSSMENHAPTAPTYQSASAIVGRPLEFQVSGIDPDNDKIRYSLVGQAPIGLQLDQLTGRITWKPQLSDAGKSYEIEIELADDGRPSMTTRTFVRIDVDPNSASTVGVFRGGSIFVDSGAQGYDGEQPFSFGLPGDRVIAGDWNGDGYDEVGVFRNGWFYLDSGLPGYDGEQPFAFGLPGDIPIAGDWDGDGIDQVGVYRNGWFYLDLGARGYQGEQPFRFGPRGARPIAGDWNGDGIDDVGVGFLGLFMLDQGARGQNGERSFRFGDKNSIPIAGDWNGDGIDEVGAYQPGQLYSSVLLDTGRRGNSGELPFQFGLKGDLPISGHWRENIQTVFAVPENVDSMLAGWNLSDTEAANLRKRRN